MKMVAKINCGSISLESLINCSKLTTHIYITTAHYVCDNNVTVCDNNVTVCDNNVTIMAEFGEDGSPASG